MRRRGQYCLQSWLVKQDAVRKRFLIRFSTSIILLIAAILSVLSYWHAAQAAQVWWDYAGHGYVTNQGSGVADAVQRIRIDGPHISENEHGNPRMTWDIYYNVPAIKKLLYKGQRNNPQFHEPWQINEQEPFRNNVRFYLFTPYLLDESSITIQRRMIDIKKIPSDYVVGSIDALPWEPEHRERRGPLPGGGVGKLEGDSWSPGESVLNFHEYEKKRGGRTNVPNDDRVINGKRSGKFQELWDQSIGDDNTWGSPDYPKKEDKNNVPFKGIYDREEIRLWFQKDIFFSRGFMVFRQQSSDQVKSKVYHWRVSGIVKDRKLIDQTKNLLLIAGFSSNQWTEDNKNNYMIVGPYDTDGDGLTDAWEHEHGTDPTVPGGARYDEQNMKSGETKTSGRPYMLSGQWTGYAREPNPEWIKHWNGTIPADNPGYFRAQPGHFQTNGARVELPSDTANAISYRIDTDKLDKALKVVKDNGQNSLQPGEVSINDHTGVVRLCPPTDRHKAKWDIPVTLYFPDPSLYHKHAFQHIEHVKATFKVQSYASQFNPVYQLTTINVAEHQECEHNTCNVDSAWKFSEEPKDKTTGRALPKGTKFTIKKYQHSNDEPLSWSWLQPPWNWSLNEFNSKVLFQPSRWTQTGNYKTPVVITYPDGSTSQDPDSGNQGKPIYAPVKIIRHEIEPWDLNLTIHKGTAGAQIDPGGKGTLDLRQGETINPDLWIDGWSERKIGTINLRTICQKNTETGEPLTYEVNGINGMSMRDVAVDRHPTDQEQATCRLNRIHGKSCKDDDQLLYEYNPYNLNTTDRTRAYIKGKAEKFGNYQCKVYALKTREATEQFDKMLNQAIAQNGGKTTGLTRDPIQQIPGDYGIDWIDSVLTIRVHGMAHYYKPTYALTHVDAGTYQDSSQPTSVVSAKEAERGLIAGALPKDAKFIIGKYPRSKDPANEPLSWSFLEQDHATNGGTITFRPHKWMDAGDYKTPVIVEYPDGTKSTDLDSSTQGNPIYAPVHVQRSPVVQGDLHLTMYKQEGRWDPLDTTNGLTIMNNMRLMNQPLADAWSHVKPGLITLRMLCNKQGSTTWSEQLSDMSKLVRQQQWKHASDVQQRRCRENHECDSSHYLYDDYIDSGSRNTTERTHGVIDGFVGEAGEYTCVVLALKPAALAQYNQKFAHGSSNTIDARTVRFNGDEGIDWNRVAFPVHVVNRFTLPKTGGQGWNLLIGLIVTIGTGLMTLGILFDQWFRARRQIMSASNNTRHTCSHCSAYVNNLRISVQATLCNMVVHLRVALMKITVVRFERIRALTHAVCDRYSALKARIIRRCSRWLRLL